MTRPVLLGILNVTLDSFSDGGRFLDEASAGSSSSIDKAIAHAVSLVEQGADVIDIGGESTRPGAERVSADDELQRVLPVVRELVARDIRVSVDTMRASTAREVALAGAEFINDVSGGLADPDMFRTIAALDVTYIASHWRGHSDTMDSLAEYTDVVTEVRDELTQRVAEAIVWGVNPERIIIDPGLGFAKTADHNWQLLGRLDELQALGLPVLIGASRKRFLAEFAPEGAKPKKRDRASALISGFAAQAGAWGLRVHDIDSTREVLAVWDRWDGGARA